MELLQGEKMRTLGFFQPFGSLMLHGKVETRWVREGRNAPFPLGKYLFYTTMTPCNSSMLLDWCGPDIAEHIKDTLKSDATDRLNRYAIGIGDLVAVRHLTAETPNTFVKFVGRKTEIIKGVPVTKIQWGLHFENVQCIDPIPWELGKQGIGFVPDEEMKKIKIIDCRW